MRGGVTARVEAGILVLEGVALEGVGLFGVELFVLEVGRDDDDNGEVGADDGDVYSAGDDDVGHLCTK